MSILDGDLAALFGAAFAGLYRDATLLKATSTDDDSGGFAVVSTPYPAKVLVESVSERARAASGLPDPAVILSVLRAGLSVPLALDDQVVVAGAAYRVIRVATDPASAAYQATGIPV